jgi:hypothetical protein
VTQDPKEATTRVGARLDVDGVTARATHRRAASPTPGRQPDSAYFTDDVNLFRVVRWLRRPSEPPLAEVENCRSLESVLLAPDDLARLAVRFVSSSPGRSA